MQAKQAAALKAVEAVRSGMIVGLGTGTTTYFAIEKVGQRVKDGLDIQAVCSSIATETRARENGIPIVDFAAVTALDLYIDGADEVDAKYNLIKGGGGALVREKILAYNSTAFVVIVDETKRVTTVGKFPLPVEIVPFAATLTIQQLEKLGGKAVLRQQENKTFLSDNGNFIVDVHLHTIEDPVALNATINALPGVVESGLFPGSMVTRLIIGYPDGTVKIEEP